MIVQKLGAMKFIWICAATIFNLSCFRAEQSAQTSSQFVMRSAYCACRCCESNQDICFRHESIPATFKCSESMCNDKFCEAWSNAKCQKDCFCDVCKDKIGEDDFRCVSHKGVPDDCKCDPKMQCDFKEKPPEEIKEGLSEISSLVENRECVIPCFCKKCKDSLPPELYGDCLMTGEDIGECDCKGLGCPSQGVLDGLKKVREMRAKTPDTSDPAYSFSDDIDQKMEPNKAKEIKCKMQCFCDVCSVGNSKIETSCDKMLPKPRVTDCNCNPSDISCPTDDVDQHCKIYCFCKGCLDDKHMPKTMKDSCKEMTKKQQACMCADQEDCSLLANLPNLNLGQEEEKKKPKKGKLKKKKPDRDEL